MNSYKKWSVLAAAVFAVVLLFMLQTKDEPEMEIETFRTSDVQQEEEMEKPAVVVVDIKGAVQKEGVYELVAGCRVKEAIERAGGFLSDADTTQINLAQIVHDQMMIVVPRQGEQPAAASADPSAKIAINIATKEELERIPGIGPKKAESILRYREEHGSFQKLEDLLEVDGIGEKSLESMKDSIIVP